ncbi:MAG: LysE family translocator [Paracoccaceae bacterium]|nr:LysE family translocator [Paracoccaceae bacterium]
MLLETLLAFALTSFVIELTPGPNMAYLAVVAATEGRRPALSAVGGVALGLGLVGLAAAFGLAAVISASDLLYQGLRWGGVVYLLWLAWDGWRDADETVAHAPPGSSNWRYFLRGLVTNLLNPKAAVFYVAVLPGFLITPEDVLRETLMLTAVYLAVATGVHASIAILAGAAQALFETRPGNARCAACCRGRWR